MAASVGGGSLTESEDAQAVKWINVGFRPEVVREINVWATITHELCRQVRKATRYCAITASRGRRRSVGCAFCQSRAVATLPLSGVRSLRAPRCTPQQGPRSIVTVSGGSRPVVPVPHTVQGGRAGRSLPTLNDPDLPEPHIINLPPQVLIMLSLPFSMRCLCQKCFATIAERAADLEQYVRDQDKAMHKILEVTPTGWSSSRP